MEKREFHTIVIGAGIAGYYAAKCLAKAGKSVALVEKDRLGGVALRWGALPVKKALDFFRLNKEGIEKYWDEYILDLEKNIEKSIQLPRLHLYYGEGKFIDSKTYKVGENILVGNHIIIATGTTATSLGDIVIDREKIITHREALNLKALPEEILILGGNVEGVEFATLFAAMGKKVTIIEKEGNLLEGNDRDLVEPIENQLKENKVRIIKGIGAKKAFIKDETVEIELEDGRVVRGDKVLTTLLRKPNFPRGLESLNIKRDQEKIFVNHNLETSEENIFAIGDINGLGGMAHIAINQAINLVDYILYKRPVVKNYKALPRAVFTLPELAGAGKQEGDLKSTSYKVFKRDFKNTWRGWSKDIGEGFVKILVGEGDTILGIWMVGENVSEYVGLLSILMGKKLTISDIKSNLIIHPSLTEAILDAIIF